MDFAPLFHTTTASQPWQRRTALPGRAISAEDGLELTVSSERDQTWWGFGGCFNELGWRALNKIPPKAKAEFLGDLFDPAGDFRFNFCRLPIGANDYASSWYSYNEKPGDYAMEHFSVERDQVALLPYVRSALAIAPGIQFFASPWSPPSWMKFPHAYNYGTLIWEPANLRAYALYLVRYIKAYASEGIKIQQLHLQNEPNSDQKFPSCLWTGEQFRDFIRDYLGPAFAESNLSTEIWSGTIERGNYDMWVQTILADPGARKWISGLGFQWAGREIVARTHSAWPDLPIIQTENECGDGTNTWPYAWHVADLLCHYLTHGSRAYAYWNMVLETKGQSTWGWQQNSLATVDSEQGILTRNPEYYIFKHFTSCIRPGAKRIILKGPWSAYSVAFENVDGSTAIILRNPLAGESTVYIRGGSKEIAAPLPPASLNTIVL